MVDRQTPNALQFKSNGGIPISALFDLGECAKAAARLGSRAKMVVLSKAALGNASRDAQRSVIGVVDSMDEPNELRQLITTVLNEIDGVWPAELSRD